VLASVRIKDFALIADLTMEFGENLNALTGETGAGKSIIVEAIGLLVGERAATASIRGGAGSAYVEGIFEFADAGGLGEALADLGIESEEGALIVSREITPSRSIARLNGQAVPLRALQQVTAALVDIQGQSEQLSLFQPARQLYFLDAFAGLLEPAAELRQAVREYRELEREIATLRVEARDRAREMDLLQYQVAEITAAGLEAGEEAALRAERRILMNSRRLVELSSTAARVLAAEDSAGAADLAGEAFEHLQEMAELDAQMAPEVGRLGAATEVLAGLAADLGSYADSVEDNPSRLEEIELRLDLLEALRRKYGDAIEDVIAFGEEASGRLGGLENANERAGELADELERAGERMAEQAGGLSAERRRAGGELTGVVVNNMRELGMDAARFAIDFETVAVTDGVAVDGFDERLQIEESGIDRVTFGISTNPGEEMMPLSRVASGGEVSRIMLALKAALSEVDATPTLVFDEIDQGIGARSADVIGEKLGYLARRHQVLCITHLPQVAAYADAHFLIEKAARDERVVTSVARLDADRRRAELAAMAGKGEGAAQTATELLDRAEAWRQAAGPAARKATR
jgi:DNA repair protein RecN (Recombination protein N)